MLRPLGRRVLVQPDPPDTETAGGLIIPDKAQSHLAMSGTVVALGPLCQGPAFHVQAQVFDVVDRTIDTVADRMPSADWKEELLADIRAALSRYADAASDGLQVGMCVAFPYTVGTTMPVMDVGVDGEPLILIDERDIVAAWMPESARVETAA